MKLNFCFWAMLVVSSVVFAEETFLQNNAALRFSVSDRTAAEQMKAWLEDRKMTLGMSVDQRSALSCGHASFNLGNEDSDKLEELRNLKHEKAFLRAIEEISRIAPKSFLNEGKVPDLQILRQFESIDKEKDRLVYSICLVVQSGSMKDCPDRQVDVRAWMKQQCSNGALGVRNVLDREGCLWRVGFVSSGIQRVTSGPMFTMRRHKDQLRASARCVEGRGVSVLSASQSLGAVRHQHVTTTMGGVFSGGCQMAIKCKGVLMHNPIEVTVVAEKVGKQ